MDKVTWLLLIAYLITMGIITVYSRSLPNILHWECCSVDQKYTCMRLATKRGYEVPKDITIEWEGDISNFKCRRKF